MSDRMNITVLENGPLKVTGADRISYCGTAIETASEVYLCRCGESKNAPFCDGSHNTAEFDGETGLQRKSKPIKTWEGKTLRTHFDPNVCMHVFYCQPLEALRERELAGDGDAAEEIMRVVNKCPSGALTYETKALLEEPTVFDESEITIVEGGEIRVRCGFEINADRGERQPDDRATLCRCGLSKNKPWCDGRHKAKADFK